MKASVCVLWVGLYLAPIAVQAQTVFYVPPVPSRTTLLSVSNPTADPATLILRFRGSGGVHSGEPVTLIVPSTGQVERRVSELFPDASNRGWVEVDSSVADVAGFFRIGNFSSTTLDGAEWAAASNMLTFPWVVEDGSSTTEITLANTTDSTLSVFLSLYSNDGRLVGLRTLTMRPRQQLAPGTIATLVRVDALSGGYLRAEATGPIIGYETVRDGTVDVAILNARTPRPSRSLVFPHTATGGGYTTRVSLLNTASQALEVALEYHSDSAGTAALRNVTLQPNEQLQETVGRLFDLETATTTESGWVRATADTPSLEGFQVFFFGDSGGAAAFPASHTASTRLLQLHLAEQTGPEAGSKDLFTGLALLNPSTQAAHATVAIVNADGRTLGQGEMSLAPMEKKAVLLRQIAIEALGELGGTVWIEADVGVHALSVSGSRDLAILSPVPLRPIDGIERIGVPDAPRCSVSGRVAVADPLPAGGILVDLAGPERSQVRTNHQGAFVFKDLTCGAYSLTPYLGGYTFESQRIDLTGSATNLSFNAVPVPVELSPELTAGTQLSVSTVAAGFTSPDGVWGNGESLFVTDRLDHTLHKIDIATGARSVFAGQSGVGRTADGAGVTATFWFPHALWGDGSDLYVADYGSLRKVALSTGEVTTITSGAFGGIWGDGSHLYATETDRHRIVRIDPQTGASTVLAGRRTVEGLSDGVGVEASFSYPDAIWGDGTYLYVAQNSPTIRRISISTGTVTTIGERVADFPFYYRYVFRGGLFGVGSHLYIAESWLASIRRLDLSTGELAFVAGAEQRGVVLGRRPEAAGFADGVGPRARFDNPRGLWSDGRNLYIADAGNGAIRRAQGVAKAPVLSRISPDHADRGTSISVHLHGANFVPDATALSIGGSGIVVDDIHVLDSSNLTATLRISPSAEMGRRDVAIVTPFGTSYVQAFTVHLPTLTSSSITSGHAGLAYRITLTGTGFIEGGTTVSIGGIAPISDVSVESSTRLSATVRIPARARPDVYRLYVTTAVGQSNHLDFTVLPAVPGEPTQMEVDFFVGGRYQRGSADGVLRSSRFNEPSGVWGNDAALYVTDTGNHTIRKIERATGAVSTFAGSAEVSGFVDGPREAARFLRPDGVWGDGRHLYVADTGNDAIRRIDLASGAVTTLAGAGSGLRSPAGLWGVSGVLYVSDSGNGAIRSIDLQTGSVATLAAGLASPAGLWGDSAALYVADSVDQTIRAVDYATGAVTTLAGRSGSAGSEDGTGGAARFNAPRDVWGDGHHLFVADTGNHAIRRIDRNSGVVDMLAGLPLHTSFPEAGTGPGARIVSPTAIWATAGEFYIVESGGNTVRTGRQSRLAPLLRSVTPALHASGTTRTMTLSGENFFGEIEVFIGASKVTVTDVTVVDDRTIQATVRIDADSTGLYALSAQTPYGYTYNRTIAVDAPTLTGLSPSTAPQGFTTEFTLTGTNLDRGVGVEIEGDGVRLTASPKTRDPSAITISLEVDVNAALGPRAIRLQTRGGTTEALSFTIVPPPRPRLSGLTPDRAVQGTSLQVRLRGEHFIAGVTEIVVDGAGVHTDYVSLVDHNNAEATFIIDSTAAPGVRNVRVATPGGQSDPRIFQVEAPAPATMSVSPTTLSPGGPRNVTITGSGFAEGSASVSVDGSGVAVTHVYVVNDSTLVATLAVDPSADPGSRAIHVTTYGVGTRSLTIAIAVPKIGDGTQLRVSTLSTRSPVHPTAIWGDGTNLYIAEHHQVVKKVVLATGEVIPLAGDPSVYASRDGVGSAAQLRISAIWGDGVHLYMTERGAIRRLDLATREVTTIARSTSVGGSADGVGSAAAFGSAAGIWGDGANLYVSDIDASSVRKFELATRMVTTLATLPRLPSSMRPSAPSAIWGDGTRLYVADPGHLRIQEIVIATGAVTPIAGTSIPQTVDGTGIEASFTYPDHLWGDGQNLFISDVSTVRKLRIADRVVTTVAGRPQTTCCADGVGAAARLWAGPMWSDGFRLYWADQGRIRYAVPAGAGAASD